MIKKYISSGLLIFLTSVLTAILSTGCAVKPKVEATLATTAQRMVLPAPSTTPSPVPTHTPTPTPEPVYNARINIVGDLMVHQWQLDDAYNRESDSYDFDYCFSEIKEYLSSADYTVGNLETVLADKELGISDYPMFGSPDSFAHALKNAGFDLLSTANNHCYDKSLAGVLRTIDVLDTIGIAHTGTFPSQEARDTLLVQEINNIRFVFLAYTYGTNGLQTPSDMPWLVNMLDDEAITADIERAKALEPDFIVILPHMGEEYRETPGDSDKARIKLMLEAGADIVAASHPHVLQPMERIEIEQVGSKVDGNGVRSGFVAYSLGNFVSSQRTLPRDAGVILSLSFEKSNGKAELVEAAYIPTWVAFVNAKGAYDIKVLPVNDTLAAYENGVDVNLRPKDIQRLETVKREIDALYAGQAVPVEALDAFIAKDKSADTEQ